MLLVVAEDEDIPGWLYPEAFPEVPRPPEDQFEVRLSEADDFSALWRAMGLAGEGGDALRAQYSHCSTGVPHNAPDYVSRLDPALVAALADLPEGDRWRVAQAWATERLGKRANQGELTRHKELLKALCRLARRAVDSRRPLLLL